MAADKLRKASSTGVANVALVSAPRAAAETTLSLGSGGLTNWASTTSVDFTTYTLDVGAGPNGTDLITNKCEWTGRADPDNDLITELELTNGTDVGNAVDDVVICVETAAWVNDLITTLLSVFDSTGALKANSISSTAIVNSAISTIKLADLSVTTEKMAALAVTIAKMNTDARKQTLDIDGTTEIVYSTAATQPAAQAGKTIIWFAPTT